MKNSTLLLVDRHIQINHCPNLLVSKQIPDFNKVKPWIPSLLVGKPGNSTVKALQILVKKEKSFSRRRTLREIDRRRLENSIRPGAHRGLRMLQCSEELLNLTIDCPVDTTKDEFA